MSDNSYGGMGDLELLRLWQDRGDERAFEEVYARRKALLTAILMRYLKDEARVEDALQEVWLKLVQLGLAKTHSDEHLVNWLKRIAVNLALDLIRRGNVRGETAGVSVHGGDGSESDTLANEPDPAPSALDIVLAAESAREVREYVQRLDEAIRPAVSLFLWGDLGYQEIVEVLGTPYGPTRRNIIHSLKQIWNWIEENRGGN
jgi:RNA polymerase sigma-70 factor (ECF subfamily)